jgi:hypothetical protein
MGSETLIFSGGGQMLVCLHLRGMQFVKSMTPTPLIPDILEPSNAQAHHLIPTEVAKKYELTLFREIELFTTIKGNNVWLMS